MALRALSTVIDPAAGTLFISLAAGLGLAIVIGLFLVQQGQPEFLLLAIPMLILVESPLLSRSQTPDMLAAALFVPGLICFLRSWDWPASAFFMASIFVRPDYVVFASLLPTAFIFMRTRLPWIYLASLVGSLAIYWVDLTLGDYPGWWRHFVFAFVKLQPTMEGFDPPFSLSTYVFILSQNIVKILYKEPWPWVAAAAGVALLYFRPLRAQLEGRMMVAFTALMATLVVKLFIFPSTGTRVYQAFVIGLLLLLAEAAARARQLVSAVPADAMAANPR